MNQMVNPLNWRVLFLLTKVLILPLVILIIVATDARETFTKMRLESRCEAGQPDACGHLALILLRDGETVDDMKRGMELMVQTCRHGFPESCRMAAVFQGRRQPTFGGNTVRVLWNHRNSVITPKCLAGDAKACFVVANATRKNVWSSGKLAALSAAAMKSCKATQDMHGCAAASILLAGQKSDDSTYASEQACRAGFAEACARWADAADEGDWAETLRQVCEAGHAPAACKPLLASERDGVDELYKAQCWNGEYDTCASVKSAPGEAAAAMDAFYSEMATLSDGDFAGYSFPPFETRYTEGCTDGVAEACFLEGVRLVNGLHEEWEPADRPTVEAIEATYGRACELGMNAGCLAGGIELLNRPPEDRKIDAANALLARSCERGNAASCWATNFDTELRAGDNAGAAQAALAACKYETGERTACEFYVATLEHEFGATPWVMSDRRMAALTRPTCWVSDTAKGCRDLGWAWDLRETVTGSELPGGMAFAAFADTARGCRLGNRRACEMMLDCAKTRWPTDDTPRYFVLRNRVCNDVPGVCGR